MRLHNIRSYATCPSHTYHSFLFDLPLFLLPYPPAFLLEARLARQARMRGGKRGRGRERERDRWKVAWCRAMNPPSWPRRAGPTDGALGVALGPRVGWLPGRRRRRERRGSRRTETELLGWKGRESGPRWSWDRGCRVAWGVGGGSLPPHPPTKSAGVRTEMLRGRVGRGCPLTT